MKRNHLWVGNQCARCGLFYVRLANAVQFPSGSAVPLVDRRLPRCGENEAQWRARLAFKKPKPVQEKR